MKPISLLAAGHRPADALLAFDRWPAKAVFLSTSMLLVEFQLPLVDCRFILERDIGKLSLPSWPSPEPETDFVRSFGGINARPFGGLPGWGENEICNARRAVRLPSIPVFESDAQKGRIVISCAFRRLYADGLTLAKYELGLLIERSRAATTSIELDADSLKQLLFKLLQMEVVIPLFDGKISTTLSQVQSYLPKLYVQNTTKTSYLRDKIQSEWWVLAAKPLILIEAGPEDSLGLPWGARTLFMKNQSLELSHFYLRKKGRTWPVWLIRSVGEGGDESARMLRLYLLRLNAENQCLRGILRILEKQKENIPITRGTPTSELLQRFFRDSLRRISRNSTKADKLAGGELEHFARTSIDALNPGQRDGLLKYLKQIDIRHNILRNLKSYAHGWANSGTIIMKQINIRTNKGSVTYIDNLIANKIENSFNQAMQASVDDALKNEFSQLRSLVSELLKKLPKSDADAVARDFSDLTNEATSKKPRRTRLEVTGQGLIEAAKTCAELVAPITKTVKAIISLCLV